MADKDGKDVYVFNENVIYVCVLSRVTENANQDVAAVVGAPASITFHC